MKDDSTLDTWSPDAAAPSVILDRFEEAWERGAQPTLEVYLPTEPAARQAVLWDLIHIDLERRIKAREPARVEAYCKRFPELAAQRDRLLALIRAEYILRRRSGPVAVQDYFRRFPDLQADLASCLAPAPGDETLPDVGTGSGRSGRLPLQFGRYRIVEELGRGGMGAVYLAHDTHLERDVALKVAHDPGANRGDAERFIREARAAAPLHHPNICPVYEAGEIDGIPYLTMAHIEGQPLTRRFPLPLPARQAAELIHLLALALAEAHKRGVIHRDLKPSNVMIDVRGQPIVMDFGLARRHRPDDAHETQSGVVQGTPAYMAPEQARGDSEAIGPATDIYGLGVVLYELLTARRPFEGPTAALLAQIVSQDPPPPSTRQPGLDPYLERICLRALAREPRHRFASMTEFAAELAAWLAGARQAGAVASEDRPPTPALPDPRAADGALQMLREWGWEQGLERLKRDTDAAAEPGRRAALQILTGWLAAERGHDDEALAPLRAAASWPALAAWALAGEAFLALRRKRYRDSQDLLRRAASAADAHDTVLSATLAHLRGTLALQEGRPDEALRELHTGLEQLGPSHFSTGRVLDTLGTVHALRNHFPFAHAFYEKALEVKRLHGDDAGVALTHGQLGRLYLSWGRLADADAQFRAGIEVARRTGDERGEAQLYNHRGQVQLARGRPVEAVALLAEAVRSATGRYPILEGYARKDRALASLMLGDVAEADHDIAEAERLFHAADFAEGLAHVNRVRGLIRRRQGRPEESAQSLRTAATWFEQAGESAEAADCLLELARTLRGRGAASILIEEALLAALDRAEDSRRPALVAAVESELREAAPLELGRRECRRLRGAANPERTAEPGSVLCVELHTTTSEGPLASLEVRNHLFADLARLFASEGIEVIQYRSDGLVALAQGPGHAVRAVRVALTVMEAISEVNRPRRVLGWPLWQAHTAIASGVIGVAAVGTFARRDYTTVGEPVCLAERLLAEARPDRPCIDDATHEAVAVSVTFDPSGPRFVAAREGPRRFWEVMGLARKSPECRGN